MSPEPCVSDFALDRLLADGLPHGEHTRVKGHLERCPRCAARYALFGAERDAFNAAGPPLAVALDAGTSRWRRAWPLMAVCSSAAAAIAFLSWRTLERERLEGDVLGWSAHAGTQLEADRSSGRGERTKGAASFELYIRHGEGIRMAADREVAHPGDQLQFAYSSERSGHIAVLSRDGAGVASVYFPDRAETWVADPGQGRRLPQSTILDATLGREQLYALFCSARVALAPALRALSEGRPPSIDGCSVRNIELEKIP